MTNEERLVELLKTANAALTEAAQLSEDENEPGKVDDAWEELCDLEAACKSLLKKFVP